MNISHQKGNEGAVRFGIDPRDLCLFLEVFMEDKTTSFKKRKIRQTNDLGF